MRFDINFNESKQEFETELQDAAGVLGIKGAAEEAFRKGYVILTKENIGLTKLSQLINDLTAYYLKSEVYNKAEVIALINQMSGVTIVSVQTLPEASSSTMGKIYLVPNEEQAERNIKDEYITIQENSLYKWEKIGSTSIDFSNVYTKQESDNRFVTKVTGKGLSTNDFTTEEKTKLSNLENYDDTELSGRVEAIENDYLKSSDKTELQSQITANSTNITTILGDYLKNADKVELTGLINIINALIPTQASPSNQLADKDFTNSSIATNTAYYISKIVSGKRVPFDSLAELEAYSGTITNNDYAFVKGTDSVGNTTYTRYKFSTDVNEWAEEYVLNNSSFTANQWEAINSGISTLLVAQIGINQTDIASIKTRLTNVENNKVDKETGKGLISDSEKQQITTNQTNITNLQNGKVDKTEHLTLTLYFDDDTEQDLKIYGVEL